MCVLYSNTISYDQNKQDIRVTKKSTENLYFPSLSYVCNIFACRKIMVCGCMSKYIVNRIVTDGPHEHAYIYMYIILLCAYNSLQIIK